MLRGATLGAAFGVAEVNTPFRNHFRYPVLTPWSSTDALRASTAQSFCPNGGIPTMPGGAMSATTLPRNSLAAARARWNDGYGS